MRRFALCLVFLLTASNFLSPARAAVTAETAQVLALQCRAVNANDREVPLGEIASPDAVQCLAYVIGIFDALRAVSLNSRDRLVCLPEAAIPETRFARIYLDWYERNPQNSQLYPTGPVIAALVEAFPCQTREERTR